MKKQHTEKKGNSNVNNHTSTHNKKYSSLYVLGRRWRNVHSRGRNVHWGGETSKGRNVQGAKRPGGETSRGRNVQWRGETSRGRNVKGAKRHVTQLSSLLVTGESIVFYLVSVSGAPIPTFGIIVTLIQFKSNAYLCQKQWHCQGRTR